MVSEEAALQGAYEQTTELDEGVSEGAEIRIVERQSRYIDLDSVTYRLSELNM